MQCNLSLLLIGESLFLNVHRTNLRVSRDWFGGCWIDVEAKPSILTLISDRNRTDDERSKSVAHVKSSSLAMSCIDTNAGTNFSDTKEETLEETALASLEKLREVKDGPKQPMSSSEDDQSEEEEDVVDTKNSRRNLKDDNGGGDNSSSDSEDENDENSNGVKSEMDSMDMEAVDI